MKLGTTVCSNCHGFGEANYTTPLKRQLTEKQASITALKAQLNYVMDCLKQVNDLIQKNSTSYYIKAEVSKALEDAIERCADVIVYKVVADPIADEKPSDGEFVDSLKEQRLTGHS
jgi:hypothetical protein